LKRKVYTYGETLIMEKLFSISIALERSRGWSLRIKYKIHKHISTLLYKNAIPQDAQNYQKIMIIISIFILLRLASIKTLKSKKEKLQIIPFTSNYLGGAFKTV
jgi:hypothetical protein